MKKILPLVIFFSHHSVFGQDKNDSNFLKNLLSSHASPQLKMIFQHPDSFRYQIMYTRIDRDKSNQPHFKYYYYNVNKDVYFNPASTVKMPLAVLALEKINKLKKYRINKYTTMLTDSSFSGQSNVLNDTSAENNLPSIAQYIRKIFLVSDNDAYNRLYEFLGQQYINDRLWEMGYKDTRITRRFVAMNEEENRHTNQIRFVDHGDLLYTQAAAYNAQTFDFRKKILIGQAHYNSKDSLINAPMDFTTHNNFPLKDLQQILQSILFPQSVPASQRFDLSADDYSFLYQYMSEYPGESSHPHYDTAEYFNSYAKFFMFKSGKSTIPPYIRIFNKPGWSYGFLTDAAYIVDFRNKIEFMISATIYVNSDGILNDDKYEYDQTGYPFFKEIGDIIYQYELKRVKKYRPSIEKLQIDYK